MRLPPRLSVVLLMVVVGLVALVVAGLLDWVVGVLFLTMEFLGEAVRNVFRRRKARRHPPARSRHAPVIPRPSAEFRRGPGRRRGRLRRGRVAPAPGEPSPSADAPAPFRVLVPVSGDEPELFEFALEECRTRRAELFLLFLRPMAVMPMGPIPLPGLAEDELARSIFDRFGEEADRAGVPMRTIYATTGDRAATIGEVARDCEADVVVIGSSRKGRIFRLPSRDRADSLLKRLPERASLMIHAS